MREVTSVDRKMVAPTHPGLLTDVLAMVDVLVDYGRYADAAPIAERLLERRSHIFASPHWAIADTTERTAVLAAELGQDARADTDFRAAIAMASTIYAPHARWLAQMHYHFASYLLRRGRVEEANRELGACAHAFDESAGTWNWIEAACAAQAAYLRADPRALDRLIDEQRNHRARELPMALWLRARLAAEPAQKLAWLDDGATLLRSAGRDAAWIGREIESARVVLGAPPAAPTAPRGAELLDVANAILAGAAGQ
jgi:hypothetical protein